MNSFHWRVFKSSNQQKITKGENDAHASQALFIQNFSSFDQSINSLFCHFHYGRTLEPPEIDRARQPCRRRDCVWLLHQTRKHIQLQFPHPEPFRGSWGDQLDSRKVLHEQWGSDCWLPRHLQKLCFEHGLRLLAIRFAFRNDIGNNLEASKSIERKHRKVQVQRAS